MGTLDPYLEVKLGWTSRHPPSAKQPTGTLDCVDLLVDGGCCDGSCGGYDVGAWTPKVCKIMAEKLYKAEQAIVLHAFGVQVGSCLQAPLDVPLTTSLLAGICGILKACRGVLVESRTTQL